MRHFFILVGLFVLTGCAQRGQLSFVDQAGHSIIRVHVATERNIETLDGTQFGQKRSEQVHFGWVDVSIPPVHKKGRIEWPRKAKPDPKRHFVATDTKRLPNLKQFVRTVAKSPGADDGIFVFVHGYNTNNAEAVYQLAQISHDFGGGGAAVLFSWPSAARVEGYVYDRDSVIFARDALERLLTELTLQTGKPVNLVGHSMGTQLIMETLRQISISGKKQVLRRIGMVALVAPDIDEDVFIRQMARIEPVPKNFGILVTKQDKALGFSALLTGRKRRLGAIDDPSALADLPVTIIDLSAAATGQGLEHSVAFESEVAIDFLIGLGKLAVEPVKRLAVLSVETVSDR